MRPRCSHVESSKMSLFKRSHPPAQNSLALNIRNAYLVGALLALSLLLAWVSNSFASVQGWLSFAGVLALLVLLYPAAWRALRAEQPPRGLLALVLGAALLRLALGALWLFALPAWGYDTDVQNAGYIMEDAYNRDLAAWQLAGSDEPLTSAFRGYSITDQYGGLLFLSAAIYRYLGGAVHQPLLILLPAAAISGLAVAFTWAAAARLFNKKVAWLAAWLLAIYPEAALLGSSQMREAFTVCLLPMALLGVSRWVRGPARSGYILLAVAFASAAVLSWPFVSSLLLFSLSVYLTITGWRILHSRRVQAALGGAALLAVAYLLLFQDLRQLWLVQSADWQLYVSTSSSGWLQRQFGILPVWLQMPFLVAYGILRPLLPAALGASGLPIWVAIGVWRALGWTALLAMLLYATYLVFRRRAWLQAPGAMLASSWVMSLVASYRGGGDLWDNPRYRSAFAAAQVILAAWAWYTQKETKDPWLRRSIISAGFLCAWFLLWYLRRYTGLAWSPIVEIYQVVGIGLACSAVYILWDWLRSS